MLLLVGMWWRQFWKLGYEDDDPDVLGRQDDQDQEHLTLFSFRRSWGSMYICLVGLAHHRGHLALYSCVGNMSIFNLTIIAHPCLHFHSFLQPESYIFLNSSPLRLCLPADIFSLPNFQTHPSPTTQICSCICLPCCCLYTCCSAIIDCICCCCPSSSRGYSLASTRWSEEKFNSIY